MIEKKDMLKFVQWLIDNKLVTTSFNKEYQEQIIEITELGIDVNSVLNELKTNSKTAERTNKFMKKYNDENKP
jgi:hypothetical protein